MTGRVQGSRAGGWPPDTGQRVDTERGVSGPVPHVGAGTGSRGVPERKRKTMAHMGQTAEFGGENRGRLDGGNWGEHA